MLANILRIRVLVFKNIINFPRCPNLTKVNIPCNVTQIGKDSFSGCNITSIEIPEGVTTIPQGAFDYCANLSNVKIPKSVTTIEDNAFEFCASLKTVTIPNKKVKIGDYAFGKDTKVYIEDSNNEKNLYQRPAVTTN